MKQWILRRMCAEDIGKAAEYEQQLFSEPWSEAALSDAIERKDSIYVAAIGDTLLGYCGLYLTGEEGYINQVAVGPSFQGQGIGKEMLSRLLSEAEEAGMNACTLEVRTSNARAIALYKGLGFEEAGIRPRFYQKPVEDALIMWRRNGE